MDLSGEVTRIYSPEIVGETKTFYEKFVEEYGDLFEKEVMDLDDRLDAIGNDCGLFEEFFKTGFDHYGPHICQLYDEPKAKLRLPFIEYGNKDIEDGTPAIILGNGGLKPTIDRATQDSKELDDKFKELGIVSKTLEAAERKGHFKITEEGLIYSTTNWVYNSEDYGIS